MKLFHGTNKKFYEIDLMKSKDKRDFGKGFYTTTIFNQAEKWAKNQLVRYGGDCSFVKEFEFIERADLKIKEFPEMNAEWLEFVKKCRTEGGIPHDYDIIKGPVANDQVSFHTEKALLCLKWKQDKEV